MTIAPLLADLKSRGLYVTAEGGRLKLQGAEAAITQEIITGVQAHKPALLAYLGREEAGQLVQSRDWADWRLEWIAELGGLMIHYRDCNSEEVRQQLLSLAGTTPASDAEWLALGATIKDALASLEAEGKLPPFSWPERGPAR